MAQKNTGITISEELFERARAYLNSQRPAGTFSGLVEVALEDFLKAQMVPTVPAPARTGQQPQPTKAA